MLDGNLTRQSLAWGIYGTHFLENLRSGVDLNKFTVISDRDKGLIPAMNDICPNTHHVFCAYHIEDNSNSEFGVRY